MCCVHINYKQREKEHRGRLFLFDLIIIKVNQRAVYSGKVNKFRGLLLTADYYNSLLCRSQQFMIRIITRTAIIIIVVLCSFSSSWFEVTVRCLLGLRPICRDSSNKLRHAFYAKVFQMAHSFNYFHVCIFLDLSFSVIIHNYLVMKSAITNMLLVLNIIISYNTSHVLY